MKYDSAFVPRLPDGSSIGMKLLFPRMKQKFRPKETVETFVSTPEAL